MKSKRETGEPLRTITGSRDSQRHEGNGHAWVVPGPKGSRRRVIMVVVTEPDLEGAAAQHAAKPVVLPRTFEWSIVPGPDTIQ